VEVVIAAAVIMTAAVSVITLTKAALTTFTVCIRII